MCVVLEGAGGLWWVIGEAFRGHIEEGVNKAIGDKANVCFGEI